MKHAIMAAVLSGLVPGMGQLYNRRPGRGVILIIFMSFFLVGLSLALFLKVGQAAATLTEEQIAARDFSVLSQAFKEQDLTLILVLLGGMALIWAGSVVEAFLDGRGYEARMATEEKV